MCVQDTHEVDTIFILEVEQKIWKILEWVCAQTTNVQLTCKSQETDFRHSLYTRDGPLKLEEKQIGDRHTFTGIVPDNVFHILFRPRRSLCTLHEWVECRLACARISLQNAASIGFPGPLLSPSKIIFRSRVRAACPTSSDFTRFSNTRTRFSNVAVVIRHILPHLLLRFKRRLCVIICFWNRLDTNPHTTFLCQSFAKHLYVPVWVYLTNMREVCYGDRDRVVFVVVFYFFVYFE